MSGLVNVDLTPEVAVRLGMAIGTALKRSSRVVASRSPQPACRLIKRSLIAGITSTGVHVADLRVMPAAINRHLLKTAGLAAGVHVSPSSTDPEEVQIQLFEPPGTEATPAFEKEISKHLARQEFRRASYADLGELSFPSRAAEGYVDDLLQTLDVTAIRRRGFRIVVDYSYSAASVVLPNVLAALGVETIAAHPFVTGRAPLAPAAMLQGSFGQVKRLVGAVGADFGVVLDQPGERLYLVDERAHEVPVEQELLLFVSLISRDGTSGRVALPLTATSLVEELVAGTGIEVKRTQASLAAVTRAAAEEGTIFAGALGGGFVFPRFLPACDAIASLAYLLELLAPVEKPVSELVAALPTSTIVHRQVRCPWASKGTVMRVLTEQMKGKEVDLLDGIKIMEEHGWAQVIPDANEPLVHVYAEGDTEEEANRLEQELRSLVEQIIAAAAPEAS
jgi:mannose-1-phosphate guanylyltransferase/phosphomannomutase